MYVCMFLNLNLFIMRHAVGSGHALPTTKEEWEALHPDRSYETDKDLVLPGYAGEICMYVCMYDSICCMYVCMYSMYISCVYILQE